MNDDALRVILEAGIVAIVRTRDPATVLPTCRALAQGGILALEITATVPDAYALLRLVRGVLPHLVLGMGTVLTLTEARAAIDAGARFLVSPTCDPSLSALASLAGVEHVPGAFTPSEVYAAHRAGARLIKVFPAGLVGPGYIKDLRGPFPDLKLVPTGGVTLENAGAFLRAGAVALGVGGSLADPKLMAEGRWQELEERARGFGEVVRGAREAVLQKSDR